MWLIVLEFTVVRAGFFFDVNGPPFILLVFWALGMSMIALAALVRLPYRVLLVASAAMIGAHNLFDTVRPDSLGSLGWLWRILHVQGCCDGPAGHRRLSARAVDRRDGGGLLLRSNLSNWRVNVAASC